MNAQANHDTLNSLLANVLRSSGLSLTYTVSQHPNDALSVAFEGEDSDLLIEHDAELLLALEQVAAEVLRLKPEEHDLLRFESRGFSSSAVM